VQRLHGQLYDTAIDLFRTRGFEGTRVQDVIDEVGVSEPTFFNYFRTKEAVLDEFAARTLDSISERLRAEMHDTARPVDAKTEAC